MNSTMPYNYGPINLTNIKDAITNESEQIDNIKEIIGDPTNPQNGTIIKDINIINSDIENINESLGAPPLGYNDTIFNNINTINNFIEDLLAISDANFPADQSPAYAHYNKYSINFANKTINIYLCYVNFSETGVSISSKEITNSEFTWADIYGYTTNNPLTTNVSFYTTDNKTYAYIKYSENTLVSTMVRFIAITVTNNTTD